MARFAPLLLCVFFLSSCHIDHSNPGPCGDCPENLVNLSLACQPCDAASPIEISMENKGENAVYTDLCSWRLIHVESGNNINPFFREVVYTPDCSTVDPIEVAIPPGSTVVLTVEVDPAAISLLSEYPYIVLELTIWWVEGDISQSMELRTGPVEVSMP